MDLNMVLAPLLGGVLIGLAVTVMLLFNGRVTGVSGIIAGFISSPRKESSWRLAFILGMIAGGVVLKIVNPEFFQNTSGREINILALAGLLVGFGTAMSGGCTSGHGVCGVSRLSVRSIVATVIFMVFGFVIVAIAKNFLGGAL